MVYINELPASPCTYQNKYPEMFSAAFPDNPPVRCPFPMEVVAQVSESTPMRSNKSMNPMHGLGKGQSSMVQLADL